MKVAVVFPLLWAMSNGAVIRDALREEDWTFQTYLGVSIMFHCNDSLIKLGGSAAVKWVLPNGTILSSTYRDDKYEVGDDKNITGDTLMIYNVEESDGGFYLCCTEDGNPWCKRHTIRGLNLAGHKIHNLFDKYEDNLIVAVVAALVLFVPIMVVYLTYKYRYVSEDEQRTMEKIYASPKGGMGHCGEEVPTDMKVPSEEKGSYYNPGFEAKLQPQKQNETLTRDFYKTGVETKL